MSAAKAKILVVDDEADIREFLSHLLSKKIDCDVDSAGDAKSAMEKILKGSFDLALLDIKMPGLSGVDLLQEAVKAAPKTQFVVVSGYDSHEVAGSALKAGAVDFISKLEAPETIILKMKLILEKLARPD